MKTVNSISGGKTSAYLMQHFPADYNIFSLVRVEDKDCLWMGGKDEPTRQLISDRIGQEFIATVEMDEIIYTILDLEQFTGQKIDLITGKTFEEIIKDNYNYLPNKMTRYCTVEMKLKPIFNYLKSLEVLPVEMRIGYRPNEIERAERMLQRADENGIEHFETIIGKRKTQNKWGKVHYRKATFPLIAQNITKDTIYNYWNDKPVRFAYRNNCVGCVNRQPLMISHMATKELNKVEWFNKMEKQTRNKFMSDVSFEQILKFSTQAQLFSDEDFNSCDSGFCGI
jgi:hypothetical protein